MRRGRWLTLGLLALASCATPTGGERRAAAEAKAASQGWQALTIPAGPFSLAAWAPLAVKEDDELTVYIEGDGLAWLARDVPSPDPTPISHLGLALALAQPSGNAVYLARPCQYLDDGAVRQCAPRYWQQDRFAPEVVEAMGQALDVLKARFKARRLNLVGYSGGAAIAALLAARRTDVARLVSVAGNLDHRAWTERQRVSPLTGSLNPADEKKRLAHLPQWHFAGGKDTIVPPDLVKNFAADLPAARVRVMPDYDHRCCWAENWGRLWREIR